MKTAIYIEDGVSQIILTPESEFEKNAIKSIITAKRKIVEVMVLTGSFYECQGGYYRQGGADTSLMLRFDTIEPEKKS